MSTSTDIAVRPATLPEKMAYAEALAFSGMLPEQYRKTPANILWAVEYGETIGITPMAAITGVHMIEGKPTASAALISGLVRRAGHRLRSGYDASTRTGWAEIVRFDDPEFTFRSEWNLARAIEAELCTIDKDGNPVAKDSKGRSKPWKKFFPSMTKARAITEVARDACEEVLFGLHYTPEELGADTDDEGNLLERSASWTRPSGGSAVDPWVTPAPVQQAAAPVDEVEDIEVVGETTTDEAPAAANANQVKYILSGLTSVRGITDDAAKREAIEAMVGHPVPNPAGLLFGEAVRIIATLTAEHEAKQTPPPAPAPSNPPITPAQRTLIQAHFSMWSRENRLAEIERILDNGPVLSTNDLSMAEASRVIDAIEAAAEPVGASA